MEPIPYAQTDSELRKFGLIMAGMVVLMFALVLPWLFSFDMPYWPFILAAVLIVLALLKPAWLAPVNKGWLKVGLVLGWINTRIILGIIFGLLVVPIGFIMKSLGKDPLQNKFSDEESYRVKSTPRDKQHLEKPF